MKLESELKHNGVHEANIKSSRTVRGQMLEAESEAKDKSSRPRPRPKTKFWPRGQLGLEDLTSLVHSTQWVVSYNSIHMYCTLWQSIKRSAIYNRDCHIKFYYSQVFFLIFLTLFSILLSFCDCFQCPLLLLFQRWIKANTIHPAATRKLIRAWRHWCHGNVSQVPGGHCSSPYRIHRQFGVVRNSTMDETRRWAVFWKPPGFPWIDAHFTQTGFLAYYSSSRNTALINTSAICQTQRHTVCTETAAM